MTIRKQQGLCLNCDERYHFGHRCKPTHILMILPEVQADDATAAVKPESAPDPNPHTIPTITDHDLIEPNPSTRQEISFHAHTGSNHPRSIRLPATINGSHISILVDIGSTHNYLHPKAARFLALELDHSDPSSSPSPMEKSCAAPAAVTASTSRSGDIGLRSISTCWTLRDRTLYVAHSGLSSWVL